ncbi:MAG: topoisomerase DNA-binding C4 zinc finger domain-containing protein [Saprospiraceae bacterium]
MPRLKSLTERHSSTTVCPRCGSILVERTARNGTNAGSKFLGCEGYPKCRFTKKI